MPVRIVKDNPDEMLVTEAFNFDNPSGGGDSYDNQQRQQGGGGGGFDISSILGLLGGGGQQQQSGGGLGDLIGMLGGGGQQQQSGGLGSLIGLLGGGGQQQGGGLGSLIGLLGGGGGGGMNQRGGGNTIMSVLGTMAIQACVNYAVRRFSGGGSGGGSGLFQSGAPTPSDVEALLQERYASARLCVSLWSYTCGVDRQFQDAEKEAFYGLIDETSRSLFPDGIANLDEVKSEMIQAFNEPVPYEQVVAAANDDPAFGLELYKQACFLATVDQQLARTEADFIGKLAQDFRLDRGEAQAIRSQFGI